VLPARDRVVSAAVPPVSSRPDHRPWARPTKLDRRLRKERRRQL